MLWSHHCYALATSIVLSDKQIFATQHAVFMTQKRTSTDALLEATSLCWQENTDAIQELDRRLTQHLDTLADQVGQLTEGVNRIEVQIERVAGTVEQQARTAQTLADTVQAQTRTIERLVRLAGLEREWRE